MHASEDRLLSVLCGEQAHHTFRSLSETIQKFWNACIAGVACLFFCGVFFQSSGTSANQVACFKEHLGRRLKIHCDVYYRIWLSVCLW